MPDPHRVYSADECGKDGYPWAWHGIGDGSGVKHLVREQAGNRCVRCLHPYERGAGEWSLCDKRCIHRGPFRLVEYGGSTLVDKHRTEAQWRILTVHHLRRGADAKRDLRWWNLAALCQRCHLQIQGKVQMERIWPWPHSSWFQIYAAGWYAWVYEGRYVTREEAQERMEELLAYERVA